MEKIRLSVTKDIVELKKLWKDIFHDEDKYIDSFFDKIYNEDNVICAENTLGNIVGMLYIVPYNILRPKGNEKAAYLYALAVDEKYRNKGIMGKMILYCQKLLLDRGYNVAFLMPASESLYTYYERFGFVRYFNNKDIQIKINENIESFQDVYTYNMKNDVIFSDNMNDDIFNKIWNRYKNSQYYLENSIVLDEKQYRFMINQVLSENGCLIFQYQGKKEISAVLLLIEKNQVKVLQLILCDDQEIDMKYLLVNVSKLFNKDKITFVNGDIFFKNEKNIKYFTISVQNFDGMLYNVCNAKDKINSSVSLILD